MEHRLLISALFTILVNISLIVKSQEFKHKTDEQTIKNYFWNSSSVKSNKIEIPEKWKNESAVYLIKNTEHRINNNSSRFFFSIYLFHAVIRLQDKASVEKFSTFYKDSYKVGNQLFFEHKIYYAFKLIKPDGTEKEINVKEEVITDKGTNKKRDKLAIPDLEVGDILDFYWYSYDFTRGNYALIYVLNPTINYIMNLQDEYPVLDLNFKLITGNNWRPELQSCNGASEFTKKVIDKNNYQFSLSLKNVEKLEDVIWSYPLRSNPLIKALVFYESNFQKKTLAENNIKIFNTLDRNKITKAYKSYLTPSNSYSNEYTILEKYSEKNNKATISADKKAEEYYYLLRHYLLNKYLIQDNFNNGRNRFISDFIFIKHAVWGLKKMKIPYSLLIVLPKHYGSVDNLLTISECDNILLEAGLKKPIYLYNPDEFTLFNNLPYSVEGTKALRLSPTDGNPKKLKIDEITLPVSDYSSNITKYNYDIKFNSGDFNILNLKGNLSASGHSAYSYRESLVTPYDIEVYENNIYGTKPWALVLDDRNKLEKMNQFKYDIEEKRKENAKKTITNNFTVKPDNIEFKLISAGNWLSDTIFSLDFSCNIEGLVTKAGNNFILNIGKLIGDQITIDEESINRKSDIYINFPKTFQYDIKIEIPGGYKVSGIDKLDFSVQNETGGFECKPHYMDNVLSLKIKKYYAHNSEPLKNWPMMLEFLKAANDFTEQKVVILK